MYNILIFPLSRIVLYCSNKYCNISIYCNIVASLRVTICPLIIILFCFFALLPAQCAVYKFCIVFVLLPAQCAVCVSPVLCLHN